MHAHRRHGCDGRRRIGVFLASRSFHPRWQRDVEESATVRLRGSLGDDALPHLDALFDRLVSRRPEQVVVDLRGVESVSLDALVTISQVSRRVEEVAIMLPGRVNRSLAELLDDIDAQLRLVA